jgi:hypothetical protein
MVSKGSFSCLFLLFLASSVVFLIVLLDQCGRGSGKSILESDFILESLLAPFNKSRGFLVASGCFWTVKCPYGFWLNLKGIDNHKCLVF